MSKKSVFVGICG